MEPTVLEASVTALSPSNRGAAITGEHGDLFMCGPQGLLVKPRPHRIILAAAHGLARTAAGEARHERATDGVVPHTHFAGRSQVVTNERQ